MGQTLTHGIYLPDEGERNCYNGLAGNWQLLDGAVGTVAEHTTQIAGKAPAVHTHTKSDVTDLFNSANTWSDHNTYTKYIYMQNSSIEIGNTPSSNTSREITFTDKNNATLSKMFGTVRTNGKSYIALRATNKFTNSTLDPNGSSVNSDFYVGIESDGTPYNKHAAHTLPDSNNTYDLGSSSYKWKTLNGVNPGALSLPDISRVTNIDTTGWVFDGSTVNEIKINNAVQTLNGWLYIRLANASNTDSVGVRYNSSGKSNMTFIAPFVPGASHMTLSCPIIAGVSANVWSTKQPEYIKFYLSLGEVNNFPS